MKSSTNFLIAVVAGIMFLPVLSWLNEYTQLSRLTVFYLYLVMAVFLGSMLILRFHYSYKRLLKKKKLASDLNSVSRIAAIKLQAYLPREEVKARNFYAAMIPNYAFALKGQLTQKMQFEEMEDTKDKVLQEVRKSRNVTDKIALLLADKLSRLNAATKISDAQLSVVDNEIQSLTRINVSFENLKKEIFPSQYSVALRILILVHLLILSIPAFEFITFAVGVLLTLVFALLEIGADKMDSNTNGQSAYISDDACRTIRRNVKEIFYGV